MAERSELMRVLENLFSSQLLAVLGTQSEEGPYGSLVAFAATDDFKDLLFATARSTRKYRNIVASPRAVMVVDNRSNQETDFASAVAVTATGSVTEVGNAQRDKLQTLYLAKHPSLSDFLAAPECAFLRLEVSTYSIVRKFQQVEQLCVRE